MFLVDILVSYIWYVWDIEEFEVFEIKFVYFNWVKLLQVVVILEQNILC